MPTSRLYAILDADACDARGLPLLAVGEALCRAAPDILQLRAKGRTSQDVLGWLVPLRRWTTEHGTQLYMNDRADLAELAGCDGVHVGQMDQPIASVRRHFPRLRVGVSTHSEQEFDRALSERPDYLALGPIFGTVSKRASEPAVGLPELQRLAPRARALSVPVVAIGGIDLERAPLVAPHAEYAAAIAALLPGPLAPNQVPPASLTEDVFERTRAYAAALRSS
jgi:thiamine-phosphate pyrophosphorylase